MEIPISQIIIGTRHRKDLGDLSGLTRSVERVGMLHPIVVDPRRHLIAGRRRLEAAVRLGWDVVPCRIVHTLNDALAALLAERDENTERLPFKPSEAVELGRAIEAIERPAAEKRKAAGRPPKTSGKLPEDIGGTEKGRTTEKAAEAAGMSRRTYEKAKTVVEAAEADPKKFGPVAEQMDRTGKVEPAYQAVQKAKRPRKRKVVPATVPGAVQSLITKLRGVAAEARTVAQTAECRYLDAERVEKHFDAIERLLRAKPAKVATVDISDLTIPENLNTPQVKAALGEWLAYKRKRRESYRDPRQLSRRLDQLSGLGPRGVVEAIEYSIAQNYQGIHPERNGAARPKDKTAGLKRFGERMRERHAAR